MHIHINLRPGNDPSHTSSPAFTIVIVHINGWEKKTHLLSINNQDVRPYGEFSTGEQVQIV